jgi:predicted permease
VDSARRGLYDADDRTVTSATILSVVVAVILMIICANVANLMLSRAIVRHREIAVRLALGASRGRLVRQMLTESLVLASIGAVLGLTVAYWGVQLLPAPASRISILRLHTLGFISIAAVVTSVLFGAVPALRTVNVNVNAGLSEGGRGMVVRRRMLGRPLLIVQVALSLVLLVGAGLFLQTVTHLRHADVGFDTRNLLVVRITPRLSGYDPARTIELYRTLLDRFAAIPGIRGVAVLQPALLSNSVSTTNIFVEGQTTGRFNRDSRDHEIHRLIVSPSFFQVLGIPVLRGRGLTDRDDAAAPKVAVINETAARTYFPGQDPIGKRFGRLPDRTSDVEVVGVARDAKYSDLRQQPPPTMYVSHLQTPRATGVFELRTGIDPLSVATPVRRAIHQVDPNLPIISITTQQALVEGRFEQEKLFATAYTLFGGIALLLASIGLFGVVSYSVGRRTAEMGVRMALGAQRSSVVRMIMRESLTLVGIGIGAGVALSAGSARLVATLLYGVPPYDIGTLGVATAVMIGVSAVAAYLPARRASRIDPLVALRHE